jgi:hypothetical protein
MTSLLAEKYSIYFLTVCILYNQSLLYSYIIDLALFPFRVSSVYSEIKKFRRGIEVFVTQCCKIMLLSAYLHIQKHRNSSNTFVQKYTLNYNLIRMKRPIIFVAQLN